jgi:glutathione S-transferase
VLNWARPAAALMQSSPLTLAWLQRCMARPAYLKVRENG